MSIKAAAVAGVRWTTLSTVLRVVLLFVRLSVLTRLLDPRDFGLMSLVALVLGFGQTYVELGFSNAIIQKKTTDQQQLSTLFWLNVLAGLGIAGLLVVFRVSIAGLFNEPTLAGMFLPAALVFPLAAIEQQFRALFARELDFRRLALLQIVAELAGLVVAVGTALAGAGAMSLVYATLSQAAITGLYLFAAGVRRWPVSFHFRPREVTSHIRFGFFQLLQQSLTYLSSNVDTLLIGRYLGTDTLGLYTLAMRLIRLPQKHLNPMLSKVAMPAFAKQQHNLPAIRQGVIKIQRALAYATLPMLVGAFVTSDLLIPVLYGPDRTDLIPVFDLLVWPGMFQSLTGSMGAVHLALGRVVFLFGWSAFALMTWSSVIWVAAQYGFRTVLLARLVTGISMSVLFAGLSFRAVGASILDSLVSIARPVACTAIMALVVWLVRQSISGYAPLVLLGVQVSVGALVFAGAAWMLDRPFVLEMFGLLFRSRAKRRETPASAVP
jgi:O-antigen/teichoic acid export membrane protein